MDTPDFLLVFIKSSLHFNFAVLVSYHDDIASLKKKAEAQHQDLFPNTGRILARAIKIIRKGVEYTVEDSSPVICFVDRAKGICFFIMDAVVLPPIPPQTHALTCGPGDASSGRYLMEGGGNSSCTLQSLKRKSVEGNTNKYSIVEGEETIRVDELGQCARDKGNKKKSKEPYSDEVLTCAEGVSLNRGGQIIECTAASQNEIVGVPLKRGSSPAGSPGDAYSDRDLIEGGSNLDCTLYSLPKRFLEDNANKDRAAEEDVTLEDNSNKDRAAEEDVILEDNSNKDCAVKDVTLEDNANQDSAVEEDATQCTEVLGQCARDKGNKKSKDASSDGFLTCNERGSGREIYFSSENETTRAHLKRVASPAGSSELPSEDPLCNAHSLGHLAEKLACTASDKGKDKFLPSVSSSSCCGLASPNYERPETHKARHHVVTTDEACTSSRAIRVENLGGEESNGQCCEKYMTMEEPSFTSEELEDEFARINHIESDEILARSLQDEFDREHQTHESDEEADYFMENFLSQERYLQIPECRRAQLRFSGPAMDHENLLISQLLHEFTRPEIDNHKKEELLDELVATNESRADMEVDDGFDFYQDLFYDEDENVQMPNQIEGATESRINHLPVSEIQDNNEDACIICLETPSIGSVMRHLPCFHKFHECVDKWLLIRNSCPVCKLAID